MYNSIQFVADSCKLQAALLHFSHKHIHFAILTHFYKNIFFNYKTPYFTIIKQFVVYSCTLMIPEIFWNYLSIFYLQINCIYDLMCGFWFQMGATIIPHLIGALSLFLGGMFYCILITYIMSLLHPEQKQLLGIRIFLVSLITMCSALRILITR